MKERKPQEMQLKKATYQQRKVLKANNCDAHEWLIKKVLQDGLEIVNRNTGEEKTITVSK